MKITSMDGFNIGDRVRVVAVTHVGMPEHEKAIGQTGVIYRFTKCANTAHIKLDAGGTWGAFTQNIAKATGEAK